MTTDRPRGTVPDLDAPQDYAERSDRQRALFFVGRESEIAVVERHCARALRSIRVDEVFAGATILFQGAPGAGKSALLAELRRRWTAWDAPVDAPRPVLIPWNMLWSEEDVTRAILQAVVPKLEAETRQVRSRDVSGRAGLPVLGGEVRTGSSISPAAMTFDRLAMALSTVSWRRPLCLMVDEIQNVDPAASNVLSQLHLGEHRLPIVPVFAGLGSSAETLQRCGLPRLSAGSVRDIGALAPAEAREAVERMLGAYRVDPRHSDRDWPGWLAEISEGWPQHLHNGMRDSTDFLDHLVHKGVFQLGPDRRYDCPFPSLRDYLVRYGSDPEPTPASSPRECGDALPRPTPFYDPFQV